MSVQARVALASGTLLLFAVLAVLIALVPDTGWNGFFGSLAAIYGVAFVGLVAGWFWARWFARGVGMWGTFAGAMLMLMTGLDEVLAIFALTHLAVVLLLSGNAITLRYDGRTDWRERMNIDDRGYQRLGDLFTNLGGSLPYVAFYAFSPRQSVLAILAGLLALAGGAALLRVRSWGLLALGGASVMLGVEAATSTHPLAGALAAGLLAWVILPFVPLIGRWLFPIRSLR